MGSKRKHRKEKRMLPEIRATLVQHSKRGQNNPCAKAEDGFIQKNRGGNYESDHKSCKYTKFK